MIAPLYGGKSAHELLAAAAQQPEPLAGYDIVRETWKAAAARRQTSRPSGGRRSTTASSPARPPTVEVGRGQARDLGAPRGARPRPRGSSSIFRPDPTIWDGRFANNGWLQELPKPLTKLTWDNAAQLSPATAERLGLTTGRRGRARLPAAGPVRAPVWIHPGQADDTVTVHLGYGRTRAGRVGNGAGFNAYRSADRRRALVRRGRRGPRRPGETDPLASTQLHRNVDWIKRRERGRSEERELVRVATLADFLKHPDFARQGEHGHEPAKDRDARTDDDFTPNNPIRRATTVGDGRQPERLHRLQRVRDWPARRRTTSRSSARTRCSTSREMHWIDVDRYYHGDLDNPEVHHQPRLCMHCENAPCELVCPVAATVHDSEGLNNMVYNRCVGTRYCCEQLPVQGPALQLPPVRRPADAEPGAAEQPRRDGAGARA